MSKWEGNLTDFLNLLKKNISISVRIIVQQVTRARAYVAWKKNNNSIRVSGSPSYIILSTDETISFIGIQLKKKFLKYKKGVPELVG